MALVELLGDRLKGKEDDDVCTSSISGDGKYVGLYFSAHWCPPCQAFTPKLVEFYKKFKSSQRGADLEIVFISSDKDNSSFDEYYSDMPWLALPYDLRTEKNKLSKKFKVSGIPSLVILDSQTGEVVCENGRGEVADDPDAKGFPWKPRSFAEVIPGKLINNKKEEVPEVKDKITGLYFSAHWCPPCRNFTPELVKTYNKLKEDGRDFEIIFITWDRAEESFTKYFQDMPWLAIPYGDPRVAELAKVFQVAGIPSLIILDAEGKVITAEGRGRIMKDPEGKEFPWYPLPCCELDSFSAGVINEEPCLILFADIEEDDDVKKAMDLMKPVAEEIIAAEKEKGKKPACKFIVAGDDDIVENLQHFLGIADESLPLLVLVDIPEQRVAQCDEKEINAELIRSYYQKFASNQLEWTAIQR
ncbi:nucleoredoxin-like [Diadema antillarum]|uniref:nucleoredoxin-like n=1 Tax=Diadema antillarum TaxID=105358 RepID=UPI003A881550